jgi:hypothetical protein
MRAQRVYKKSSWFGDQRCSYISAYSDDISGGVGLHMSRDGLPVPLHDGLGNESAAYHR